MINSPFKDEEAKAFLAFHTKLNQLINTFSNHQKYVVLTLIDSSLFTISIAAAIGFESGIDLLPTEIWQQVNFVVLDIAIKIGLFWCLGIYQQVLQYTGGEFIFTIAKAVLASSLAIAAIDRLFLISTIPASVLLSDGMLTLILAFW
jgi:FlaA1/EpsC-like NDP-sugar epimerase